jgi:hypothetical protein
MARRPSERLHRLIRALSPSELRYFRIFVRGKSQKDSKYLRALDWLYTHEHYDSEALQLFLYGAEKVTTKKYAEMKAYLYDLLLSGLRQFDEERQTPEQELNTLMRHVSVLFKRGHYTDCAELLHRATKTARQFEYFQQHLDIIRWEKHLAYVSLDVDFLHRHLAELEEREQQLLAQLNNLYQYRSAFFELYALLKHDSGQRNEQGLKALQQWIEKELFSSPEKALSGRALIAYYRVYNLYYYAVQDLNAFAETGKKLIEIIENQSFILKENLTDYIAALSNMILASGLKNDHGTVDACLQKLRAIKPITEDDRRKIHRQYYTARFALCQSRGEFEAARSEIEACQAEATQLQSSDYETASFHFQYACICFGCADFEGALDHVNEWMSQPRSVEREDLQVLGRLLELILHYELGNTVLLESLLRSAMRFMRKKNRLYGLERRFIHLMRGLERAKTEAAKIKLFETMSEDWQKMPGSAALNQALNLHAWFVAKATKQEYAGIVRQKWVEMNTI